MTSASSTSKEGPRVAIVVPCHNEQGFVDLLLPEMLGQVSAMAGWHVVAVNDASTDATGSILDGLASRYSYARLQIVSGNFGSPGSARSAGVAAACSREIPDWIMTTDADVEIAPNWARQWADSLDHWHFVDSCGALNGVERQDHLYQNYPNARLVSDGFGRGLARSESAVGVVNLNGVNHGVRMSAYRCAGPYVQPTMPGPDGDVRLAGEDWDLGLRLRLAGYSIEDTPATVFDRGRRFFADVHAYVSGEAYEGAFHRVTAVTPSGDVIDSSVDDLHRNALERSLRHFFFKPILAGVVELSTDTGLSESTIAAMRAWMHRWPYPTFSESRNGFVFGRLERFASEFTEAAISELGLASPFSPSTLSV